MPIMITLPNDIAVRLQRKADAQHLSVKEVALDILKTVLEAEGAFPTPETVVSKIKATPPNPQNIRPPRGSLADALRNIPDDPDFDLAR